MFDLQVDYGIVLLLKLEKSEERADAVCARGFRI